MKHLKGIYVLFIRIDKAIRIKIGALGEIDFDKGLYAYIGSAQNNLELRVARHRRKEKRLFWHIDYLLSNPATKVTEVIYELGDKSDECIIAKLIEAKAQPIRGFGCSDCRCTSHLFKAKNFGFLREMPKSDMSEFNLTNS